MTDVYNPTPEEKEEARKLRDALVQEQLISEALEDSYNSAVDYANELAREFELNATPEEQEALEAQKRLEVEQRRALANGTAV